MHSDAVTIAQLAFNRDAGGTLAAGPEVDTSSRLPSSSIFLT